MHNYINSRDVGRFSADGGTKDWSGHQTTSPEQMNFTDIKAQEPVYQSRLLWYSGGFPKGMKRRSNKNEQLGNIWDVVSSLAQALTDARDQLVGLINYPGTRGMRPAGKDNGFRHSHGKENIYHSNDKRNFHHDGNTLARYRGGGYSPTAKPVRSIHRQHARGHVAFGAHSEFKPQPCKPCKPERGGSGPGKPGKRGVQFGIYLDLKSNCMQISTKKGGNNPVKINFGGQSPEPQYACNKDANCRPFSMDSKRHCIGTQYAALLKEEAFRIRERRLAEEIDPNAKPKWTRC